MKDSITEGEHGACPFRENTGQPHDPAIGKDRVRCGGDDGDTLAARETTGFGGRWKDARQCNANATKPKARHRH
jgi:hypothetical protein